jgi:hypothetical protein
VARLRLATLLGLWTLDLCSELLYDKETEVDLDAFTFDLLDEDAPHAPVPVRWSRLFQVEDPLDALKSSSAEEISGVFGAFFKRVDELLMQDRET